MATQARERAAFPCLQLVWQHELGLLRHGGSEPRSLSRRGSRVPSPNYAFVGFSIPSEYLDGKNGVLQCEYCGIPAARMDFWRENRGTQCLNHFWT